MQHLPFHPIIVPDPLDCRIEGITGLQVQAHDVVVGEFVLKEIDEPIGKQISTEQPSLHAIIIPEARRWYPARRIPRSKRAFWG